MDVIGSFLQKLFVLDGDGQMRSADLYDCYRAWCAETGEEPLRARVWADQTRPTAAHRDLVGDRRLRSTARAPALCGTDDGVGGLAARAIEDRERPVWAP